MLLHAGEIRIAESRPPTKSRCHYGPHSVRRSTADVVVTDGCLDQLIALTNAKSGREEDVIAEHAENAETKTEEEREWRSAVDSGAGS
jgi:hypothetical protein